MLLEVGCALQGGNSQTWLGWSNLCTTEPPRNASRTLGDIGRGHRPSPMIKIFGEMWYNRASVLFKGLKLARLGGGSDGMRLAFLGSGISSMAVW